MIGSSFNFYIQQLLSTTGTRTYFVNTYSCTSLYWTVCVNAIHIKLVLSLYS
jgi:hypothetical protein